MFIINEDKSIYITRGDFAVFTVRINEDDSGEIYIFRPGDIVRFKVFEKKGCDSVVLQKDFPIIEESDSVEIRLLGSETKIGGIIHKPKDFWYEVELNPETYPQTVIGYDEDGAKTFRLLPEGKDLEPSEDDEQQGTTVYDQMLVIVAEMQAHSSKAAKNSQTAAEAAVAAQAAAESAASVREDADNGVFTPQIGANRNWWIGGKDTGEPVGNVMVGDVIETTRTDLADEWVLCNGELVPEGELPELREELQYNTEWRLMENHKSGTVFRPVGNTDKWWVKNKDGEILVYDPDTGNTVTVDTPYIAEAKNSYGMFGITHDGTRYILGVYEQYSGSDSIGDDNKVDDKLYLVASEDLENWEVVYTKTDISWANSYLSIFLYKAKDLIFDGHNVVVYCEYTSSTSTVTYGRSIYAIDVQNQYCKTLVDRDSGRTYDTKLIQMPNGYWSCVDDSTTVAYFTAYEAGSFSPFTVSSSSYEKTTIMAWFNDRYWMSAPTAKSELVYFSAYDLQEKKITRFTVASFFGSSSAMYLSGIEFDREHDEWVMYCSGNGVYEVRISVNADPTQKSNYRYTRITALPTTLSHEQMNSVRAQITSDTTIMRRLLRDPNLKYLPTHDGETYKYINAGGAAE